MNFLIDKAASRLTVQAFATGMLSVFGHNPTIGIRDYAGEIQFVPETFDHASVRVSVQTAALDVLDEIKSDDRRKLESAMYKDVLEIEQYPTAGFQSKQISIQRVGSEILSARVTGDLSFHGVTRTQAIDARITDMRTMLRISGEFSLLQSDYGIKPVSFAAGTLRLKDEIKFKFELVARTQE